MVFLFIVYVLLSIVDSTCEDHLFCANEMVSAQKTCECDTGYFLDEDDIIDLRKELRIAFDTVISDLDDPDPVKPLLATTVRLAFHDCGAGVTPNLNPQTISAVCDGCINLDNPEHAGLAYARKALDKIYETSKYKWYNKMSRADFWMISATIAVEYGVELSGRAGEIEEIGYFCGRKDCPLSPTTNEVFLFPPALGCMKDLVDWFEPRFGFNEFDIVGILGAHSLGMGHEDASGFEGPWVDNINKDKLDNEYYIELKGEPALTKQNKFNKWKQIKAPGTDGWQWIPNTHDPASGDLPLLMLNADMVNERDICYGKGLEVDTGKVIDKKCRKDNRKCPFSSGTAQDAMNEYQQSNQDWLDAFAPLFRTMITVGSDTNKLCRIRKQKQKQKQKQKTKTKTKTDSSESDSSESSESSDDAKLQSEINDDNMQQYYNDESTSNLNEPATTIMIVSLLLYIFVALLILTCLILCGCYFYKYKSNGGLSKNGHIALNDNDIDDEPEMLEIDEGHEMDVLYTHDVK